jgi:hypothetical protein
MDFDENLFSVEVHFIWMPELPVAGLGKTKSNQRNLEGGRGIKNEKHPFINLTTFQASVLFLVSSPKG